MQRLKRILAFALSVVVIAWACNSYDGVITSHATDVSPNDVSNNNSHNVQVKITFRDGYTSSQGHVEYSVDNGANWVSVTANMDSQVAVTATQLRIRIVPETGYSVDPAGMTYRENTENPRALNDVANSSVFGGLTGSNGYYVTASATAVEVASVEFRNGSNSGQSQSEGGDTRAHVTGSSPSGTVTVDSMLEHHEVRVNLQNTYSQVRIAAINGSEVGGGSLNSAGSTVDYFKGDHPDTVSITFATQWSNRIYQDSVTINGHAYSVAEDFTRSTWLANFYRQEIYFTVEDVPVSYQEGQETPLTVQIAVVPITEEQCYVGNFLWSADPARSNEDLYIGDSRVELIKVTYPSIDGGNSYTRAQLQADMGKTRDQRTAAYVEYETVNSGYENGEMMLPEGSWVTMQIYPNYGYQCVGFEVNGTDVIAEDEVGVYSFKIGKGNFHIGARIEETPNEVNITSTSIREGAIDVSEAFEGGTAKLEIADAQLSAADQAEFKAAAADYQIENYVDISLFNTVYKGSRTASWDTQISELSAPATIGLALADDLSDKEIVVVHEHNGEIELLPAEWIEEDGDGGVIFQTSSFSNYAIAYRDKTDSSSESSSSESASSSGSSSTGSAANTEGIVKSAVTETKLTGEDGSKLNVTVISSTQGPKAMAVINNTIPQGWELQGTYNLMDGISTYSDPKTGKLVLTIPASLQKTGRSFAIILLAKDGKPYLLTDEDEEAGKLTVTLKDNNGYAFALIYGDGYAANTSYVVRKGDSLSKVAKKFGTTVQFLVKKNGIANPNIIRIGQKLIVK